MRSFHSYQFWISFPKTHLLKRLSGIQISIGIIESRVTSRRKIQISQAYNITSRRRRIQLLRTRITSRRRGRGKRIQLLRTWITSRRRRRRRIQLLRTKGQVTGLRMVSDECYLQHMDMALAGLAILTNLTCWHQPLQNSSK